MQSTLGNPPSLLVVERRSALPASEGVPPEALINKPPYNLQLFLVPRGLVAKLGQEVREESEYSNYL